MLEQTFWVYCKIKKEFALTITWLWLKCVLFDTENCSNIETFGTKAKMHIVLKKSLDYAQNCNKEKF